MGYNMIEISAAKQGELAEHAEKVLKHAGKLMSCIEDMCEGEYGERMGYRDDEDPYMRKMNRERMGYRQGVRGTGPYGMGHRMDYRDPYYA